MAKVLRKISSQGIRTIVPSKAATDDFVAYSDAFFPRTNMALKCSSWSNGGRPGARIHGHWPGSGAHVAYVRREPRWEGEFAIMKIDAKADMFMRKTMNTLM